MNKRGQIDIGDINPLAVFFGVLGAGIGWFMVKSMGAFNISGGETYQVALIWRILTPIATGITCFFLTQKMFE